MLPGRKPGEQNPAVGAPHCPVRGRGAGARCRCATRTGPQGALLRGGARYKSAARARPAPSARPGTGTGSGTGTSGSGTRAGERRASRGQRSRLVAVSPSLLRIAPRLLRADRPRGAGNGTWAKAAGDGDGSCTERCSCTPGAGRRWGSERGLSGWIKLVMKSIRTKVLWMPDCSERAVLAVQRIGIASRATVPGETRSREGWGHRDTASGGLGASAELAGNPRARSAEMLLLLSWRVTASHYFSEK